jgi:glycosyltransferase involved in cell wall biosynthesis
MPEPQLSIIVCTKNRAKSLERTLRSLLEDPSAASAEVLVVDNGSTDETARVIQTAQAESGERRPVRVLSCVEPGHSRARNHAIPEARGEFVAFTDDDVTVQPGWIDALLDAFTGDIDIVGGRVIPEIEGDPPSWLELRPFFSITLWDYGPEPIELGLLDSPRGKPRMQVYPIGANMAFRRALLTAMGEPFNPQLGHTGKVSMGYDEWDLFDRLVDTHEMVYQPRAVVRHHVDADRLQYERVRRLSFQIGFGAGRSGNLRVARRASYPRRIYRVLRGYRRASAVRRHNSARTITPDRAFAEFDAYWKLGRDIETLLTSAPWLAEQVAARLVTG